MEECWRDIEGYQGLYQVSNLGRVKSLERMKRNSRGYYKIPERILKAKKRKDGYLYVNLYKEGAVKSYSIHRLVAESFLPNPNNLPIINHKDENKENNIVSNLEFCSYSYNNTYNDRAKKAGKKIAEKLRGRKLSEEHIRKIAEANTGNPKLGKPVIGINKTSGLIVEFPSVKEAERQLGIDHSHIVECCKGKLKSAGGYTWMYTD